MGQPRSFSQCGDQQLLLSSYFSDLLILNEAIRYFLERILNRLLILNDGELLLGLCKSHTRLEPPACKDWLSYLWHKGPRLTGPGKQMWQLIALKPKYSRQTDGREESTLRD